MALHLSGILKDQKWSFGAHFLSQPIFKRRRGERGEKNWGLQEGVVLVGLASHFWLKRDQATYKGRFEEIR